MILIRAATGAIRGVLLPSSLLLVALSLRQGHVREAMVALLALPLLAFCFTGNAAPGALVPGFLHSRILRQFARRARSRLEPRRVGVLPGLPLGLAGFFPSLWRVSGSQGVAELPKAPLILAESILPALAGGVGLGVGAVLSLDPVCRPRPAPVRRLRRTEPVRKGPPLFDRRPNRVFRRTP